MTTLEFRDALFTSRFSYANGFVYSAESLGIFVRSSDPEVPYITRGNTVAVAYHPKDGDVIEIHFSTYNSQLGNRVLNGMKIKEILDSARVPIIIKIGEQEYLAGKGFLAHYTRGGTPNLLYIATYPTNKTTPSMEDIRMYISKQIYTDTYKKVQPILKDIMNNHVGDVIVTPFINRYSAKTIEMPIFRNLSDRKIYVDHLIDYCIDKVIEKVAPPKPKEKVVISTVSSIVEKKKMKEAEILSEIRTPTLTLSSGTTPDSPPVVSSEILNKAEEIVKNLSLPADESEEGDYDEPDYDEEEYDDYDDDEDKF